MRIQQARQELGLTQQQLASRLHCTQAALSHYESGKRRLYFTTLEQIAEILNKPMSYFLESFTSADEEDIKNWDFRYPYR